jgi:hypothetical protein
MHCPLPYPVDPCLYDYISWILTGGYEDFICQVVTGKPCL